MKLHDYIIITIILTAGWYITHKGTSVTVNYPVKTAESQPADAIDVAIDLIHWQESRCGQDDTSKVGAAEELGEYQATPIYIEDVKRLTGVTIDPFNDEQCRWAARKYLEHYAPLVDADTPEKMAKLYRYGKRGYERSIK